MGLLDDAIREHLELKRRTGLDAGELARLEHEAFGPIQRGGEPSFADQPVMQPPPVVEPETVAAPDDEIFEFDLDTPPQAPAPPMEEEWEPEPPPAPQPVVEPTFEPPPAPSEPGDQPTAAYSVSDLEELHGGPLAAPDAAPPDDATAAGEPGEHDVLEDTPDFLEETPEHDRLWFEQKPPRDFDF